MDIFSTNIGLVFRFLDFYFGNFIQFVFSKIYMVENEELRDLLDFLFILSILFSFGGIITFIIMKILY